MTKLTAFVIIIALRIFYHPVAAQPDIVPFASPSPVPSTTLVPVPAKLISFNASISNNRIFLQWQVGENESADQFEVEKSTDGKNFVMTALVFGTDKPETGNYWFYEKQHTKTFYYRIKMITKTRKTEYSPVIEVNPNA
jgi:hypothetical protein